MVCRISARVKSCCCVHKAVSVHTPDKSSPSVLKEDNGQLATQRCSLVGIVLFPSQGLAMRVVEDCRAVGGELVHEAILEH